MTDRFATLDLGSNSFHLLVADIVGKRRIRRVETRKVMLRLAEPVAATGELGRDARSRAREAVGELVRTARSCGATRILAVATEAMRAAADGPRLVRRLHDDHGVRVRVLEGLEEAELSLHGMAGALNLLPDAALLGLDLGGGSYEVAYGGLGPLLAGASLPLGGARLTSRGGGHDPLRLAERVALHEEASAMLRPVAEEVRALAGERAPRAAGTAGTIRDLGRLGLSLAGGATPAQVRGLVVTRAQLELAYARLCSMTTAERVELPGVSPRRVDLLPAGGAVVLATMEAFRLEQLELCDWGLREGALLDAVGDQRVLGPDDLVALR